MISESATPKRKRTDESVDPQLDYTQTAKRPRFNLAAAFAPFSKVAEWIVKKKRTFAQSYYIQQLSEHVSPLKAFLSPTQQITDSRQELRNRGPTEMAQSRPQIYNKPHFAGRDPLRQSAYPPHHRHASPPLRSDINPRPPLRPGDRGQPDQSAYFRRSSGGYQDVTLNPRLPPGPRQPPGPNNFRFPMQPSFNSNYNSRSPRNSDDYNGQRPPFKKWRPGRGRGSYHRRNDRTGNSSRHYHNNKADPYTSVYDKMYEQKKPNMYARGRTADMGFQMEEKAKYKMLLDQMHSLENQDASNWLPDSPPHSYRQPYEPHKYQSDRNSPQQQVLREQPITNQPGSSGAAWQRFKGQERQSPGTQNRSLFGNDRPREKHMITPRRERPWEQTRPLQDRNQRTPPPKTPRGNLLPEFKEPEVPKLEPKRTESVQRVESVQIVKPSVEVPRTPDVVDLTSDTEEDDLEVATIGPGKREGAKTPDSDVDIPRKSPRSPTESFHKLMHTSPFVNKEWIEDFQENCNITAAKRQDEITHIKALLQVQEEDRHKNYEERLEHVRQQMQIAEKIPPVLVDEEEEEELELPALTPEMEEEIDQALVRRPANEVLADGFNMQIKRHDMETLGGLNWLNDTIINFYLSMVAKRSELDNYPSTYSTNTFFYTKLMSQGHNGLKRWTRKVDIFKHDYMIIPVHLGMHWCLAVIDFRRKQIRYYDSMGGTNNAGLAAMKKYLQDESLDKKKVTFDMSDWELINVKGIPQQMNGSDCGMFACKYAEYITRDADITFSQEDMPYFRRRMVYEIIKQQLL